MFQGASEIVLEFCTQYYDNHANIVTMTEDMKKSLLATIEEMASRGLRTLALAYTDFSLDAFLLPEEAPAGVISNPNGRPLNESPDENLILMGIVGIKVRFSMKDDCRSMIMTF